MDPQLIDRIYECSIVPELWPGVLDELGRLVEGPGGSLFIAKTDVQFWTDRLTPVNARKELHLSPNVGSGADSSLLARLPHATLDF